MPEPHVFVIAPTRQWFTGWCRQDCEPPENPNDRKFIVFTKNSGPGHGYNITDADRLVVLGHGGLRWRPRDPYQHGDGRFIFPPHPFEELLMTLMAMGFRRYDDGLGRTKQLGRTT